jgi:hypothetical protein
MEFEKWMNYLINIACAVYQIDPAEINFPNNGGGGSTSSGGLGDGGMEEKLKHSKDKGLRPLLRFVESLINKHIVSKFDQRFVFAFAGMDSKSEKEIVELNAQRVKVYKTVNEIRKEEGLPKLEGGDIILDPTYIQYLAQQQQAEMMQQQGGGGMPGQEGGDEDGQDQATDDSNNSDDTEEDDDQFDWQDEEDDDDDDQEDAKKSMSETLEALKFDLSKSDIKFLTIEIED